MKDARPQIPPTPLRRSPRDPVAVVWLVLVAATVVSWAVGGHHGRDPSDTNVPVGVVVLVIALAKARLVASWFMEVRTAPRALRVAFDAYFAVATVGLVGAYLLGGA